MRKYYFPALIPPLCLSARNDPENASANVVSTAELIKPTRSHAESLSELVLRIQRREVAVDGVHEAGGVLDPARDLAGGHVCLWLHRDGQESLCDVAPRIQVPVRSPSPQRR